MAPQAVYDLQHRILARLARTAIVRRNTYTIADGPAKGLRRRGGFGFLAGVLRRPTGMRGEEAYIQSLIESGELEGRTIVDVGADQGLYTLAFARAVGPEGLVIALEPVPDSADVVAGNVALNGFTDRVELVRAACGESSGSITLTIPGDEGARSSADPAIVRTLEAEGRARTVTVPVVTLARLLQEAEPPALVKIDVEGFEAQVLRGLRASPYRPALVIEMHGADDHHKRANAVAVYRELSALGYREILHVESGMALASAESAANIASRGHIATVAVTHTPSLGMPKASRQADHL